MARPFRFQPPALPDGVIPRARLNELLERRWTQRLVTVVAGPGFGKTSLLVASLIRAGTEPVGRDVWLSCEAADASADHLISGLAEALGLPSGADLEAIQTHVWADAPAPLAFVLDDVHEVPPDSEGAHLIGRLVADLPANGHLVLASREPVPVTTARLAASGQLVRIREEDLVLDDEELRAFARIRGVEEALLRSTGGWPALAELTASTGADLVLDYLWEEVLARVGPTRSQLLARLALVGGGDDETATALAGRPVIVDELVAGLPLVQRSNDGRATLHPLWAPPLRTQLQPAEADEARRSAAGVHRRHNRLPEAIDLYSEAGAWNEVLAVVRDAATLLSAEGSGADFGRWWRALPEELQQEPAALFAQGLEIQARSPSESVSVLQAAAAGFRARGDVDGEIAAIAFHGLVLWWFNDPVGLMELHQRVTELAAEGAASARFMEAVGVAALAHLVGDSGVVFTALDGVETISLASWRPVVQWFRSVAHRRDGELAASRRAIAAVPPGTAGGMAAHLQVAALRTAWLQGEVEHVCERLPALRQQYEALGDGVNIAGTVVELAAKKAWLGDPSGAELLLSVYRENATIVQSPMADIMRVIAEASIAVARGDEQAASDCLRDVAVRTLGRPESWYWRDRGACGLVHLLVPETRSSWETEPLGPPHVVGLRLVEALEAARAGDLAPARALRWPSAGAVRANLPLPWVAELIAAGAAADNPAPEALTDELGSTLRPALQRVKASTVVRPPVAAAARRLVVSLPSVPETHLCVRVLGPLTVERDGEAVQAPELRRQRVRELLCLLVVRRKVRREEVTEELWPDLDEGGRNLRVTLSYLQRVLQPDRADEPPYFLRSEGPWLHLHGPERLEVDVWQLDALLEEARAAERAGSPHDALAAYRALLPLWRGDPYADAPYSDWAEAERTRLRQAFTAAAVRAGNLLVASGDTAAARHAAQRAIHADPTAESGYQLLAHAHLADGDPVGASQAVEACGVALAALDLRPSAATEALRTTV